MDLSGKSALLTGATGGLGGAIAAALAERGARLLLSGRSAEALADLAASLPGEHRVLPADLAEPGAAETLCREAGAVDVLVANAGLPGTGRLESFTAEQLARCVRVNLEAPAQMARALIPDMRERGEGHLLFVSSLSGKAASPRSSLYNATKFGLRGLAFGLRQDLAAAGIGVSVVSPGFIREAGMFAESGTKLPPGMGTRSPEDVGAAVVKAIERNRAEVAVAPPQLRLISHLALSAPAIAARVSSSPSGNRISEDMSSNQTGKR